MMHIGVVSDTHSKALPAQLLKDLESVDFIIHTGDFCTEKDVKSFRQIKDVKAVYGNMDDQGVRKLFPEKQIIKVEKVSIGLIHGYGPAPQVLDYVKKEFAKDKVDVVIFGHSHQPLNQKIGSVLYFNPGSPNDTLYAPYCSYGLMEVSGVSVTARIIKVG